MSNFTNCPKCGSHNARYVVDHQDVTLRCLCGYLKVVATRLQEITIEHPDTGKEVTLPKKGSRLWDCLVALYALISQQAPDNGEQSEVPPQASTQDIHTKLSVLTDRDQTMSEVSSQLTVLRYKGLVRPVAVRRGMVGGSTWVLTEEAVELLG